MAGYKGRSGLTGVAALSATLALPLSLAAYAADDVFEPGTKVTMPSGQDVTFLDVIKGVDSAQGSALRYRFVAPGIARDTGEVGFAEAEEDMAMLCQDHILPYLLEQDVEMPEQIIIVMSDRPVEFGVTNPDATQFFEAYRPEGNTCIWEGF
ncbi:DUF6497 family protein [Aliiroseovarius sp. 2305UL8-7]|uniref:DUF6497 family protein n=1 Tax=Aliiroseovarius conchicola TaxID=3121637 RepID=UPI003529C1DC